MEETKEEGGTCQTGTCQSGTEEAATEEQSCGDSCNCSCDTHFEVSEDTRLGVLLMLMPMLSMSLFSVMGLV